MLDTTHEIKRDQFRDFCQGGMGVQTFARRFNELALFIPMDMAINALRVSHFRHVMSYDLHIMCCTGRIQTYTELLNLAVRV